MVMTLGIEQVPEKKPINLQSLVHPDYFCQQFYWEKWRSAYEGGEDFKRMYLKMFSNREDSLAFENRRCMSYVPAFAKTGINEIRNSIFQRLSDITRVSTSISYMEAIEGKGGGVDRRGSTMEYFLGTQVLTELLVMGKVGIYVDNPNEIALNYAESRKIRPYLYVYKAEQIKSWKYNREGNLVSVLLEDRNYTEDPDYCLPCEIAIRYRYLWINSTGGVSCQMYNASGLPEGDEIRLNIPVIPLKILHISSSLMCDVADYQIALMNIASSDVIFTRLANVPIYVEMYDKAADITQRVMQGSRSDDDATTDGSAAKEQSANQTTRAIGALTGRRIPRGLEFPKWVAPSADSLKASIEKQEQMKSEIRTLLYLTLGNLQPSRQSADSKQADISQEENGLSYIGFELSIAENGICELWQYYENNTRPFSIKYPQTYDIKTTQQRLEEATGYIKLIETVPSLTYKKELLKLIAKALLSGRVSYELLEKINTEIDKLKCIVDPMQMISDLEQRLVSHEFASEARGYPEGETDKANDEAIEHAVEIMKAQTPPDALPQSGNASGGIENPAARGLPELSANPKEDITKDRNKNQKYTPRGKGKLTKVKD